MDVCKSLVDKIVFIDPGLRHIRFAHDEIFANESFQFVFVFLKIENKRGEGIGDRG